MAKDKTNVARAREALKQVHGQYSVIRNLRGEYRRIEEEKSALKLKRSGRIVSSRSSVGSDPSPSRA